MDRTAYDTAAEQYGSALGLAGNAGAGPAVRARLHLGRARAHHRRGDPEGRRVDAERCSSLAREAGDVEALALAALEHGGIRSTYGVASSRTMVLLDEALDLWRLRYGAGGDQRLRSRLMARAGQEQYHVRSFERAETLTAEALVVAEATEDPVTIAAALEAQIWVQHGPHRFTERLATINRMYSAASIAGSREWLLLARIWRGCAWLELGEFAALEADVPEIVRQARDLNAPAHLFRAVLMQGTLAIANGDHERGMALANEAYAIGSTIEPDNAEQCLAAQLLPLFEAQGLLGAVVGMVQPLVDKYPDVPGWRCAAAYVYAAAGDLDAARVIFDRLALGIR